MSKLARELWGPLRAAIGAAMRRRSLLVLLIALIGTFGVISWVTFSGIRHQRDLIEQAERGALPGFELFRLGINTVCDGQKCEVLTNNGEPLGVEFPAPEGVGEFPPTVVPGPTELPPDVQAMQDHLPEILSGLRGELDKDASALGPLATLHQRIRAAGTFWGVLFAVILGATLLGAEWRWGVWRTLLSHEPRRQRVLFSRLLMLWLTVLGGLLITLAFTVVADTVFRIMTDVHARGGPGFGEVLRSFGETVLSLEVYGTIAGSLATIARASFAGIGGLVFLLADGIATGRFKWLRHILPAQQVATLIPTPIFPETGYAWWPAVSTGEFICEPPTNGFGEVCRDRLLPPIPQPRAFVVLLLWVALASAAAWFFVQRRDVPQ